MLILEEIDLAALSHRLRERLGHLCDDYLDGRRVIRDAIAEELACSELEAEDLTDTLEARGFLRFPRFADSTHSARAIIEWRISYLPK